MLASELAEELGVDPSVITKRLTAYRAETGQEKTRLLDAQTAEHMREVHRLLQTQTATTTREAVQRALGRWVGPLSTGEAHQLSRRIEQVDTRLQQIGQMVGEIHDIVTTRQRQRGLQAEQRPPLQVHGQKLDVEEVLEEAALDGDETPDGDSLAAFRQHTLGTTS
ncbi:hypothetical protein V3W47_01860 [Deinococcus sp. YIM 134068]|uniref:hypothetical protein n=1 Tax=Deinococcus lichenicola TaxID=3118910 RepID=UPI002F938552